MNGNAEYVELSLGSKKGERQREEENDGNKRLFPSSESLIKLKEGNI